MMMMSVVDVSQAVKKMDRQPSLCSQLSMMQMRNSMASTSDTDDVLNQILRGGSAGSSLRKSRHHPTRCLNVFLGYCNHECYSRAPVYGRLFQFDFLHPNPNLKVLRCVYSNKSGLLQILQSAQYVENFTFLSDDVINVAITFKVQFIDP